jgi:hypothetical protein
MDIELESVPRCPQLWRNVHVTIAQGLDSEDSHTDWSTTYHPVLEQLWNEENWRETTLTAGRDQWQEFGL